jgi:predicted YcjX-like family ATPase
MSKLSEAFEVKKTNRALVSPSPFFTVEERFTPTPFHYEYIIRAVFGSKVVLTDEAVADGHLDLAIKDVRRSVIEAVFGEFRTDIHTLYKHLYERDVDKALEALRTLDKKMFTI